MKYQFEIMDAGFPNFYFIEARNRKAAKVKLAGMMAGKEYKIMEVTRMSIKYRQMSAAEIERRIKGMEEGYETLSLEYLRACLVAAIKRAKARIFGRKEDTQK